MTDLFADDRLSADPVNRSALNRRETPPLADPGPVFQASTALKASQRDILGLPVCDLDWDNAFEFAARLADMPIGQTTIAFLNAHCANLMLSDPQYRGALARQVVFPDGQGVDVASQVIHGRIFRANLNGVDFVPALLTYMEAPKRVALVGAEWPVLLRATEKLREHAPWHEFNAVADASFEPGESAAVTEKVRRLAPDILLVSMGSPVQEKWIDRHVTPGHARLVISVSNLFDEIARQTAKTPERVHHLRFAWLLRLIKEPRLGWYRYIVGYPRFLHHVARYKLRSLVGRQRGESA
ncbi:WecB/TagA/CpsF family glycosyltransferase [Mycoplana ramosa]|uniref:WecB/TagA/CpsF family glycosyltransferase n=1 Tax=Mycoplana ramosa TaxID=40837 RepID=A0ABW3YWX2_MYCRA